MRGNTGSRRQWWPNVVSLSRLALLAPLGCGILFSKPVLAVISFSAIIISDIADGALARRLGVASPLGTLVDHTADASVVITASALFAHLGFGTWLLPVAISIAFLQYALDAIPAQNIGPRPSRLGRVNGILYFVFIGACIVAQMIEPRIYAEQANSLIDVFSWALFASTSVSVYLRTRFSYMG